MRITAFLLVFMLIAPLNGAEPGEALTIGDLVAIHEKVAEANEYWDNEFIFEETVADALNEAEEYKGRPVKLVMVVVRVTMDHVVVEAFPRPDRRASRESERQTGRRASLFSPPQLVMLARHNVDEQAQDAGLEVTVGFTSPHNPAQVMLNITSVVPLELAKTLRNGDNLEVIGKLADVVKAAHFAPEQKIAAAKFVITDPAAQKATD